MIKFGKTVLSPKDFFGRYAYGLTIREGENQIMSILPFYTVYIECLAGRSLLMSSI